MVALKQIGRFTIVGGAAFCIDFGVLWLLSTALQVNYLLASCFSFCISVVFNYILSTLWVFNNNSKSNKTAKFILFCVLSFVGLLINAFLMWFGVEVLGKNHLIIKFFATAVVMIFNFISRKLLLEKSPAQPRHRTA